MHLPVLLKEVLDHLDPRPGDVIFDGTLGGGGHALEILRKITPGGRLIAVDRDPEAIERAKQRLREFEKEIIMVNDDFRNVDDILMSAGAEKVDGAVFDLGISSFQIDEGRRGFSFMRDGALDMRFDPSGGISAAEAVNRFGKEELTDIINRYGEERHARLVAAAICEARRKKRIETTGELAEVISGAVGRKYRGQKLNPSARTFQALRIFVNDELGAVTDAMNAVIARLNPGARVCVISFHSLEDRIVKNVFRDSSRKGDMALITKKPLVPGREETRDNPRARSAKLRVAERLT